jgi:hypothetical protein
MTCARFARDLSTAVRRPPSAAPARPALILISSAVGERQLIEDFARSAGVSWPSSCETLAPRRRSSARVGAACRASRCRVVCWCVDLVTADGTTQAVCDASADRLARDLGWTPACARSGMRPVCPLVAAIQFVSYHGYPRPRLPRCVRARLRAAPAHLLASPY